jgi:RimJ/RimL family protein N-acetyltransferase
VYLEETHVWYELFLSSDRPRQPLRPGLELTRVGADDLPLLNELPSVSEYTAKQRIEAGNDLWMILNDRQPIFACWIFHDSIPLLAARNGQLVLPSETVCMEDSITSPSYRGRGIIAPSAWSQVADRLEITGVKSIITKVEADNKVMRLVLTKFGFREFAVMHFRRAGFRQHAAVRSKSGATAYWLTEQLIP